MQRSAEQLCNTLEALDLASAPQNKTNNKGVKHEADFEECDILSCYFLTLDIYQQYFKASIFFNFIKL